MKRAKSELIINETLRRDIAAGRLRPGTPLLQDELAMRFGMSRVPVRDALRTLEAEGLVTLLPNRTAIVTSLGVRDIDEIFSIRILLESDLLRRAIAAAGPAEDAAVSEISAMLDVVRSGERFAALDRELHTALYAAADRPRQQAIVDGLARQLARFYGPALPLAGYLDECQTGHRAIVAAFLARSTEAAALALVDHLKLASTKVLALIDEGG